MTEKLREKIAKIIASQSHTLPEFRRTLNWQDLYEAEREHCLLIVDGILLTIKESGLVQLDENQELPKSRIIYDRDLASGKITIAWQRKNYVITGDEAKVACEAIKETQQDMRNSRFKRVKEIDE